MRVDIAATLVKKPATGATTTAATGVAAKPVVGKVGSAAQKVGKEKKEQGGGEFDRALAKAKPKEKGWGDDATKPAPVAEVKGKKLAGTAGKVGKKTDKGKEGEDSGEPVTDAEGAGQAKQIVQDANADGEDEAGGADTEVPAGPGEAHRDEETPTDTGVVVNQAAAALAPTRADRGEAVPAKEDEHEGPAAVAVTAAQAKAVGVPADAPVALKSKAGEVTPDGADVQTDAAGRTDDESEGGDTRVGGKGGEADRVEGRPVQQRITDPGAAQGRTAEQPVAGTKPPHGQGDQQQQQQQQQGDVQGTDAVRSPVQEGRGVKVAHQFEQAITAAAGGDASAAARAVDGPDENQKTRAAGVGSDLVAALGSDAAAAAGQPVQDGGQAKHVQVPPAPAPTPEARFVEENHPKVVTAVRTQLLPGGGAMQLRLDPPDLGPLRLEVRMEEGEMSASFTVANEQAASLLTHGLGQLKHALEGAGFSVDKLQVKQGSTESFGEHSSPSSGEQRQGMAGQDSSSARQEQQRREMLERMWRKVAGGDPVDLVA